MQKLSLTNHGELFGSLGKLPQIFLYPNRNSKGLVLILYLRIYTSKLMVFFCGTVGVLPNGNRKWGKFGKLDWLEDDELLSFFKGGNR